MWPQGLSKGRCEIEERRTLIAWFTTAPHTKPGFDAKTAEPIPAPCARILFRCYSGPLYSRVGFAHEYRPLGRDELLFVLEHHWRKLGLELDEADFTDAQAIAAVARTTNGNFRLLQRLFAQIERVMKISELSTITDDVVEAAPVNPRDRCHITLPKACQLPLKVTKLRLTVLEHMPGEV